MSETLSQYADLHVDRLIREKDELRAEIARLNALNAELVAILRRVDLKRVSPMVAGRIHRAIVKAEANKKAPQSP